MLRAHGEDSAEGINVSFSFSSGSGSAGCRGAGRFTLRRHCPGAFIIFKITCPQTLGHIPRTTTCCCLFTIQTLLAEGAHKSQIKAFASATVEMSLMST